MLMIYKLNIHTDLQITSLEDLEKLQPFLEDSTLKINKSQIARELKKDRRTIDKYLKGYKKSKQRTRSSYLDAYYDIIKELLSTSNQQIFYYKSTLWQYLTDNHGLTCPESSFRRYISKHPEFQVYFNQRKKHPISNKTHIRYETEIGKQAQLDWKESIPFTLKSGETIEVNILVLLLSYSRYRIYQVSLSKSQDVLFSLLDQAFEAFGGVPNEIVTDNMKTIMDEARTAYKKGKINQRFDQFAKDYGFRVKACIAGRPQTKAKVEAPMKLLDEIRAYNGTLTYQELLELVERINHRVNTRVHKGTGKIPILYYEKEKASLLPLPRDVIRKPYQIFTHTVKVNQSSMITYRSNQYSVPPEYIGKRLSLQVHDHMIHVYYNRKLVTLHEVSSKKLNYHDSHYHAISKLTIPSEEIDIYQFAKENLKRIGAMYEND